MMREFAGEVTQHPERFRFGDEYKSSLTDEESKLRNQLASRYSFLNWIGGGRFLCNNEFVKVFWGSALAGHWRFQVAYESKVKDLDEEEGLFLRVAPDIQFVYYYD